MKSKVIILFLIIFIFFLSLWVTQANGLQARMEKVYLQHQSKSLLKDQVKSSDKGVDLHTASVELARQQATVSIHQSVEQIINDFRFSQPNCALTYDDAAVLLAKNKGFKRFLSRIHDFNSDFTYKLDDSNFTLACIRYLNCSNIVPKQGNSLSVDEYQQCVGDIADKFTRTMSAYMDYNLLETYSYGDEIFDNGTLEDSSFDIMYDIEQINKILLANPKRIPNYYLRWPPNYLSRNLLAPSRLYAWNSVLPNIEDAIQQIQKSNTNSESSIVSNLQCFDPQPIINSDEAKEFKKEVAKLQKTILSLEEERLLDDVIGTISQPYEITPPKPTPSTLPREIFEVLQDGWNWNDNQNTDEEINVRGGGDPNDPSESWPSWTWWGWTPWTTGGAWVQCPTQTSDLAGQFDLQSDKPKIKECLQSCNSCDAGVFAKKVCYAQCLCSKFSNDKELLWGLGGTSFWLKLCLVASTTPDIITPGTQIVSIQEIMNQIAASVGKLKESGQYIPSSKVSESFTPTVKIGKLSNLLNFSINVTSRSKYRKPDKQTQTEQTENYFDTQLPNVAQLQIKGIVWQQSRYADFLQTHLDFWTQMNSILGERNSAMEQFKATQNGATN